MKMRFLFRPDCRRKSGAGHIMRCLTLARELRRRNHVCEFIGEQSEGDLLPIAEEQGFSILPATSDELEGLDNALQKPCRTLIIDHYEWGIQLEEHCRRRVDSIMVIDDLENRRHSCDILLDQNFALRSDRYRDLVSENCIRLLGPRFVLLREEFASRERPRRPRDPGGRCRNLLVFFGGSDAADYASRIVPLLADFPEFNVSIVVGRGYNNSALRSQIAALEHIRLFENVSHMQPLLEEADLFIGAGGTITWERLSMGLPGIVVPVAENQVTIARDLAEIGLQVTLDGRNWLEELRQHLEALKRGNVPVIV
ncbi:MAG: UDP-2,4-diacetamido-2,4,6-trideoxy-beta-L-altropyranose hydrolase, partial [Leptospiraceae bacterium]|nr:UDP-2,4-diacetamido-2,4,6-trideoxy-beta-L-altropyranose hydrolase [Leptospiraceae bacterium]